MLLNKNTLTELMANLLYGEIVGIFFSSLLPFFFTSSSSVLRFIDDVVVYIYVAISMENKRIEFIYIH